MRLARDIPQDSVLPQLPLVFDTEYMRREFATHLAQRTASNTHKETLDITDCRIERVKYRPGRNCLICYRLSFHDNRIGTTREQLLCARIYEVNGGLSRYRKAANNTLFETPHVPPLMCLPQLDMVVWAFPNERKLNSLHLLIDPVYLKRHLLPDVIRPHWGPDWEIADLNHDVAHYAPEYTYSLRAHVRLCHKVSATQRDWTIYGKTYYNGQGVETYALMEQLRQQNLLVPKPLLYQEGQRILWQEGLEGRTLQESCPNDQFDDVLTANIAKAITRFHGALLKRTRRITTGELAEQLERVNGLLAGRPEGGTLRTVTKRLAAQAKHIVPNETVTLHGDLHPANILLDGDRIALIDLDSVATGSAASDIGSWIAALLYRARLRGEQVETIMPSIAGFVEAYRSHASWRLDPGELRWYTATALIGERVFRCLTRLKPGRQALIDDLIHLADRIGCGELLLENAS